MDKDVNKPRILIWFREGKRMYFPKQLSGQYWFTYPSEQPTRALELVTGHVIELKHLFIKSNDN